MHSLQEGNYREIGLWEQEWLELRDAEEEYIRKRKEKDANFLNAKIEKYMPDTMQSTLDMAFREAFLLVFEKGTAVIEKTYNKKKIIRKSKLLEYDIKHKKKESNLKKVKENAKKSSDVNMIFSAVEGTALGLFGVGVPDIPVFTAVMLKSIYEIALHYGFEYKSEREQIYILHLIEASLSHGGDMRLRDEAINDWMLGKEKLQDKSVQIKATSKLLSEELLYMKFLQSVPVVGVVGGAADVKCLHLVTEYAQLKYRRRFLLEKKKMVKEI